MANYIEQNYQASNGLTIKYRQKKAKYDFSHLIVVFSGFLNAKPGNYDFGNALNDCPCDVIWINDDFQGMYTYYMCINRDFCVENAVQEFIRFKLAELGLTSEQMTVTGYSKGGSAALYHGLKYGVKNIVITVPQINVGSYVNKNWQFVAKHMLGDNYNNDDIAFLDNTMVNLLKQDTLIKRNIYLLTSEADVQYPTEIAPYLDIFKKYENFNLIKTSSVFIREHNQVTSHHVALLLGIYYSLASQAVPRFPNQAVNFMGKKLVADPTPTAEPIIDLLSAKIAENRLFVDGVGILKGLPAKEYKDVDYSLILRATDKEIVLPLAKANRPKLTKDFFDGKSFVVYDKCWFTTYQYKGVDISHIPANEYKLFLKVKIQNIEKIVPLAGNNPIDINVNGTTLKVNSQSSQLTVPFSNRLNFISPHIKTKQTISESFTDSANNKLVAPDNSANCFVRFEGYNNIVEFDPEANIRNLYLEILGNNNKIKIGKNIKLHGAIRLGFDCELQIGDNTSSTNPIYATIAENTRLIIGKDCMFATNN